MKRIFRWYIKDFPFDLVAYTNSDYAKASLDRKSTIGGCQFLGCRLISWHCKKQAVVANSITEAEYAAASSSCGQVLWIQNQLLDYGLKRRVKKLEQKKSSRTHKLKRLYKVGLSARVESSEDEQSLGEDASKQGRRINDIDEDEDITLVNVQDDADNEMFDVDTLTGDEVFVAWQNENVVEEVVDAAQVSTAATTETITTEELTLAQALEALKTSKSKVKGFVY
ncbi:hypothetical protein Tco_0551934 [Tanacetum coccineum]